MKTEVKKLGDCHGFNLKVVKLWEWVHDLERGGILLGQWLNGLNFLGVHIYIVGKISRSNLYFRVPLAKQGIDLLEL